MNTATGKQIAQERHRYMEGFLAQFYAEWEGEIGCGSTLDLLFDFRL
jgi:hypothetical protein